jgi:hypothetical protein
MVVNDEMSLVLARLTLIFLPCPQSRMTISKLLRPASVAKVKRLAGQKVSAPGQSSPLRLSGDEHGAHRSKASLEGAAGRFDNATSEALGGASLFLTAASQDASLSAAPSKTQLALQLAHHQQFLKLQESLRRCQADLQALGVVWCPHHPCRTSCLSDFIYAHPDFIYAHLASIAQLIQQDAQDSSTTEFYAGKQRELDVGDHRRQSHVEDASSSALQVSQQAHNILPPLPSLSAGDSHSLTPQMGLQGTGPAKPSALDAILNSLLVQASDANVSGPGIARPIATHFQYGVVRPMFSGSVLPGQSFGLPEEGSSSVTSRALGDLCHNAGMMRKQP